MMTNEVASSALSEALACLDRGWFITPLCWPNSTGQCACPKRHTNPKDIGKAPILGTGYQDRLLSREEIERCWARYPYANYAILLKHSALFVLDADSVDADREAEARGVPPGPRVRTAKGVHRHFLNSAGVIGRTTKRGEDHSLDIFSDGYVVGPGSCHKSGSLYTWEVTPEQCPLEDPPVWAISLLQESKRLAVELETLLQDLPPVAVDTLAIPDPVKTLIKYGPHGDAKTYPSRSEAVFACLTSLLRADYTDAHLLASILLDPRYPISEKPREQGRAWLASEIARAKAKYAANGNGHATWASDEHAPPYEAQCDFQPEPEPPPYEDEPEPPLPPAMRDEEENARIIEEEREPEAPPATEATAMYPCHEILWQGVFAEVARRVGMQCWEVWAGTYAALSAVAQRNLHWRYFGPLYGMSYTLVISPTGSGKSLVTETCADLLPDSYPIRHGIQSGPGLVPVLTDDPLDNKTGRLSVKGRPVILICDEWSRLAQVIGFLKGKSAIAIVRQFGGKERNFTGEHFWARGYAVSTVGFELEQIRAYIRKQEDEDPDGGGTF